MLRFEELATDATALLERTCSHLGLSPFATHVRFEPSRRRKYPAMTPATAERLKAYFAPHNAELEALLGTSFDW